jgi:hypothetical protein
MNKILAALLAFFSITAQASNEATANESSINGLRLMALKLKAEEIGLTKNIFPNEVFGILMETGFENGSFTLLVLADGTTSLYFSNGGGIIGAGTHESVKKASKNFLLLANEFRKQTKPTNTFPYPTNQEVRFFLIGRSGVTTYSANENGLGENRDPLSKLFHASHLVITELRQVEEARKK